MMFLLGAVLFGSLVMMPQLLQTLMGYTADLVSQPRIRLRASIDRGLHHP